MCSYNINDLPNEILEIIFLRLPSVVDQINLCLVCHHWRNIILGLRNIHRGQPEYTFDRHIYIRLPVAGSLNDWGKYSKAIILLEIKLLL